MRRLFLFISALFFLALPHPVAAQQTNGCRPIFGGGDVCMQEGSLLLDKKFRNPATNQFADHAEITELQVVPGQTLVFQLTLRNTGNRAINNITITDIFPHYVSYTKGQGTFDKATNTLTIPVAKLEGGQSTTITLEGKVASRDNLTAPGPMCVVNQASAKQGRNISMDTTQFCLQTTGAQQNTLPVSGATNQTPQPPVLSNSNVSTSPKTGPELLLLIALLPAGAAGIYLRKKSF